MNDDLRSDARPRKARSNMTKLIPFNELAQWRLAMGDVICEHGKPKRVATVLPFDYIGAQHVNWLRDSKALGTHLVVGMYSNLSMLRHKMECDHSQDDRAFILSALECVDAISVLGDTAIGIEAFLSAARPHVFYTARPVSLMEDMVCRGMGCEIVIGKVK